MKAHYHVMLSLPGCLPDSNDVCSTKQQAQGGLAWLRDTMREAGYTARGSLKSGFFDFSNGQYAEIATCWEDDCLEYIEE